MIVTETALTWTILHRLDGDLEFPIWHDDEVAWELGVVNEDKNVSLIMDNDELWHLLQVRTDARMRHLDRAQRDGLLADCGSPEGMHALLYAELKPDDTNE